MRRKILSLFLFLSVALTGMAQNPFNSNDNHRHLGLRIGLDFMSPGDAKFNDFSVDMFNTGVGFSFGAVYNLPIVANLYIEPGALLFYDTFGSDGDTSDPNDKYTLSIREFGVRVPVMVGYHFDLPVCKIHLFCGPEFRLGLHGREVLKYKEDGSSISESTNSYKKGEFNRFNSAFRVGAGLEISKLWVSLSGSFGTNMLNNDDHVTSSLRLVNLAVGYNF